MLAISDGNSAGEAQCVSSMRGKRASVLDNRHSDIVLRNVR